MLRLRRTLLLFLSMVMRLKFYNVIIFSLFLAASVLAATQAHAVRSADAQYPGFSDPGVRSSGGGGRDGLSPVAPNVDGS